jgi:propionyl-CoA carboxylase alpha chain
MVPAMIRTLLIANRGEIAVRIARTCRRLGITTVAVHSDADADALHVRACDLAVHLPGTAPADTYLRVDLLLEAARSTGADAVHPGYGFLAEHAGFAAAVTGAGLTWIGPPAAAIAAMGSKIEAKATMRRAGVPVLPDSSADPIDAIGYPMLVKASAGGGGRGMRLVRAAEELEDAIAAAQREAGAAFGDGTVFCERFVERGRHIEVQVMADAHGNVATLHERECSIQRRHQKIVEECPSPAVDTALRARLCEAAVVAAEAVDYLGAGTVEFLLAPDGTFAFLEMNTRLQVEHPVTELVTGLDLVELQLLVAEGGALPAAALHPAMHGHAVEVRLTAEDPAAGYVPATGTLHRIRFPDHVRVDSGVDDGSVISPHYDSMVAKVIAHGPTRTAALRTLGTALRDAQVHGPTTNLTQLRRILEHPVVVAGELHTGFLEEHPCTEPFDDGPLAPLAAALAVRAVHRSAARIWPGLPAGWRNNPAIDHVLELEHAGSVHRVGIRVGPSTRYTVDEETVEVEVAGASPELVELRVGTSLVRFHTHVVGDPRGDRTVYVDGPTAHTRFRILPRFPDATESAHAGSLVAPMPGSIVSVTVEPGAHVTAGQVLVTLEAMKMEHRVLSPTDGVVTQVLVMAGQQVENGQALLVVDDEAEPSEHAAVEAGASEAGGGR